MQDLDSRNQVPARNDAGETSIPDRGSHQRSLRTAA